MRDLTSLAQHVAGIALQAGKEILAVYADPQQQALQLKADDSPVTSADLREGIADDGARRGVAQRHGV